MNNKPKWKKPDLVVLVRGAEEAVLAGCKVFEDHSSVGPGYSAFNGGCLRSWSSQCCYDWTTS